MQGHGYRGWKPLPQKKGVWLPVGAVFIVWERHSVGAASSREITVTVKGLIIAFL